MDFVNQENARMISPWQPETFEASIGGPTGPSYHIQWTGELLLYERFGAIVPFDRQPVPEERAEVLISSEVWEEFWAFSKKLRVWKWDEAYDNPEVVCGTRWSLEIVHGDKQIHSWGSNAYPPRFQSFCKAVSRLVGDQEFS